MGFSWSVVAAFRVVGWIVDILLYYYPYKVLDYTSRYVTLAFIVVGIVIEIIVVIEGRRQDKTTHSD